MCCILYLFYIIILTELVLSLQCDLICLALELTPFSNINPVLKMMI